MRSGGKTQDLIQRLKETWRTYPKRCGKYCSVAHTSIISASRAFFEQQCIFEMLNCCYVSCDIMSVGSGHHYKSTYVVLFFVWLTRPCLCYQQ